LALGAVAGPAVASSAAAWSKAYCNAREAFDAAYSTATSSLRQIDLEDTVAYTGVVRQGLTDTQTASAAAITALKKAGSPKVKKGATVQKEAVAAFEEANRVATEGLAALQRGDVSGVVTAASALTGARTAPTEFHGGVLQDAVAKDKKLGKAVAKACA
jgi:hypothetical protein